MRFDVPVERLAALAGCDDEVVRAIVGHLARIGVIQPSPSAPDRVLGRVTGVWDGRALAPVAVRRAGGHAARWRQYRAVWSWVEGTGCRRARASCATSATGSAPAPDGPCCDVCDPALLPARRRARRAPAAAARASSRSGRRRPATSRRSTRRSSRSSRSRRPALGRTRAVEMLRGGRSKVLLKHA